MAPGKTQFAPLLATSLQYAILFLKADAKEVDVKPVLSGKVAVVTGGASGIGRASALLLAEHGAHVVILDLDHRAASDVASTIATGGGEGSARAVDVSQSAAVDGAIKDIVAARQRIDILVHCAGICPRRAILEMSDAEWRQVLAVNLDGTFFVTRSVGKVMADQRSGTMILLTSDRGTYGSADYPHYAASKGGMLALTKSLAIALGPHGVTVNGLNPGFTDTPLARAAFTDADWTRRLGHDPLARSSMPEDIAQTVLFLAATGGSYMTGQIVTTRMRF